MFSNPVVRFLAAFVAVKVAAIAVLLLIFWPPG